MKKRLYIFILIIEKIGYLLHRIHPKLLESTLDVVFRILNSFVLRRRTRSIQRFFL